MQSHFEETTSTVKWLVNFTVLGLFKETMLRPVETRSMGRSTWLIALAVTIFTASGFAATGSYRPLSQRQPLAVGVTADSYPYGFVTNDGQWSGFSSDLMDAV